MAFGPDGNLYLSDGTNQNIKRYNGITGAFIDVFIDFSSTADEPGGLLFHHDGNLYVEVDSTGFSGSRIDRFDATTGAFGDNFVLEGAGGLAEKGNIALGPEGNLYVQFDQVFSFDGKTGAFIKQVAPKSSSATNGGIVFGPDDNLYTECGTTTKFICVFDGKTGAFIKNFTPNIGQSIDCVFSPQFSPNGDLYLLESCDNQIKKYDGTTGNFDSVFLDGTAQSIGNLKDFHIEGSIVYVAFLDTFADPDIHRVSSFDLNTGNGLAALVSNDLATDCETQEVAVIGTTLATRDVGDLCLYNASTGIFISATDISSSFRGLVVGPDDRWWISSTFGESPSKIKRFFGAPNGGLVIDESALGISAISKGIGPTRDNTRPTITVPVDIITQSTGGAKTVTYSVNANDNIGVTSGPTCTPSSGSSFQVGTTTVECTASDAEGNVRQETFKVTVELVESCDIKTTPEQDTTISSDCTITSTVTAGGNVTVQNGAVLTIPSGITLDIDFATKNLTVQSGGGVLIEAGGKIT